MCEDGHYHDNLDIARLNKRDGEGDIFLIINNLLYLHKH